MVALPVAGVWGTAAPAAGAGRPRAGRQLTRPPAQQPQQPQQPQPTHTPAQAPSRRCCSRSRAQPARTSQTPAGSCCGCWARCARRRSPAAAPRRACPPAPPGTPPRRTPAGAVEAAVVAAGAQGWSWRLRCLWWRRSNCAPQRPPAVPPSGKAAVAAAASLGAPAHPPPHTPTHLGEVGAVVAVLLHLDHLDCHLPGGSTGAGVRLCG
jgi:hypothetical protein